MRSTKAERAVLLRDFQGRPFLQLQRQLRLPVRWPHPNYFVGHQALLGLLD